MEDLPSMGIRIIKIALYSYFYGVLKLLQIVEI